MSPKQMADLHARAFVAERPWSEAEFDALLDQRGVHALHREGAFALYRSVADETELLTLATHPDRRRQGLARALCGEWLERARRDGAMRAFLEVAADNAAAIALYEGLGFAEAGRRRAYYARQGLPPADAITMFFDLTSGQASESERDSQESG